MVFMSRSQMSLKRQGITLRSEQQTNKRARRAQTEIQTQDIRSHLCTTALSFIGPLLILQ
jgi:hypothetical protein